MGGQDQYTKNIFAETERKVFCGCCKREELFLSFEYVNLISEARGSYIGYPDSRRKQRDLYHEFKA